MAGQPKALVQTSQSVQFSVISLDVPLSTRRGQGLWEITTEGPSKSTIFLNAEIVPSMQMHQIVAALMGLLIAGGMLVPGNIPNIIAAGKLKIESREWARFGVPVGMVMMIAAFLILLVQR